MKQFITRKAMYVMLGLAVTFTFSQCSKSDAALDESSLQESQMAHKSLNLKKEYTASLDQLNNSGAHGTATLMLEGNMLTVKIEAMGLEAGKLHPQHIHGFMESNKNSTCPGMDADTNMDGVVDLAEGAPYYGPVLLSLTQFPTADASGNISYMETFEISKDLLPLQNRAIVLHGLTVDNQYVATLPVACGQIKSMNGMNE